MKRHGNLYNRIYSIQNLVDADCRAMKGKADQAGVREHKENWESNILSIRQMLIDKSFKTSSYKSFIIREPKEREIFCLPYYPDRIIQHAIVNVIKPVFNSVFTADTYASIEGKGTHAASFALRKAMRNEQATKYCLKLDIKKFYLSIDHDILKQLLRRKFKDKDLLELLDGIIDSADGVPIGNYLSQYFANFYLSYFDHWLKEVKGVPYYFRYKDDMVFLSDSKETLHQLLADIKQYLKDNLKLTVKGNYQVFPITKDRGIDFVGYVHYHGYVRLRKSIKKSFARKMAKRPHLQVFAAYMGWAKHCNSKNLLTKLLYDKIQRFEYRSTRTNRLRRRQDEIRQNTQPGSNNSQMGNKTIGVYQRMCLHAN